MPGLKSALLGLPFLFLTAASAVKALAPESGPSREEVGDVANPHATDRTTWDLTPCWARGLLIGSLAGMIGIVACSCIADLRKRFRRPPLSAAGLRTDRRHRQRGPARRFC
jgi:hypothetical protein